MELILLMIMCLLMYIGVFIVVLKCVDLFITRKNKKKVWRSKYKGGLNDM